jgi:hypothetical protein
VYERVVTALLKTENLDAIVSRGYDHNVCSFCESKLTEMGMRSEAIAQLKLQVLKGAADDACATSSRIAELETERHQFEVELHVHLDGSIPVPTLLRLSRTRGLVLPGIHRVPTSESDVWAALAAMGEVWRWFDLVNEVIGGDEGVLFDVAYEFVSRQAAQHVTYTEVRYDPVRPASSSLANASIPIERVVSAIAHGLRAGSEAHSVHAHQVSMLRLEPHGTRTRTPMLSVHPVIEPSV